MVPAGVTFVYANVLVYAVDRHDDRRRAIAKDVLRGLWRATAGVLSTQVLQEYYNAVTRRLPVPLPASQARTHVAAYARWCRVHTDPGLIISASRLGEERTISFWDALMVEAALLCGATTLLTEDLQHGRWFGPLVVHNPFWTPDR